MAIQTDVRRHTSINRQPAVRKPHRVWWPVLLVLLITVAAVAGVVAATQVTDAPSPSRMVTIEEPNANAREGRVPATVTEPNANANAREGRVPATVVEQNADGRENRMPRVTEPNVNIRDGRPTDDR